jgi:hypothetical protein
MRLKSAVRRSISRGAFGEAEARWPGEARSTRSIVASRRSSGASRRLSSSEFSSTALTTARPISTSRWMAAMSPVFSGASRAATIAVAATSAVLTARTWDRRERVRIAYAVHRQKGLRSVPHPPLHFLKY